MENAYRQALKRWFELIAQGPTAHRAGVPRSVAMKMVGHKTETIYRRYAIVDEAILREGAEKLASAEQGKVDKNPVLRVL